MTKKNKKIDVESEESVQEMLRTWDILPCKKCGKQVSMLNGGFRNDSFYCRNCYKSNER